MSDDHPRNPLVELLGDAIAHAIRQPGVLEAIRQATTPAPIEAKPSTALRSKKDLAVELGVSSSTVDRLVKEGMPRAAYVGDSQRFDVDTCRAWLSARGKKATKAPKRAADVDVSDVVAANGLSAK